MSWNDRVFHDTTTEVPFARVAAHFGQIVARGRPSQWPSPSIISWRCLPSCPTSIPASTPQQPNTKHLRADIQSHRLIKMSHESEMSPEMEAAIAQGVSTTYILGQLHQLTTVAAAISFHVRHDWRNTDCLRRRAHSFGLDVPVHLFCRCEHVHLPTQSSAWNPLSSFGPSGTSLPRTDR
jgi:hypothetical protein